MDIPEKKQLTIGDLENQASLRATFAQDTKQEDIHVDALHIQADETPELDPTIDFSTSDSIRYQEDKQLHYWRWFLRLVTVTWVSVVLWIVAFFVYQYTYQISQPSIQSPAIKSTVDALHGWYKNILGYLGGAKAYRQFAWTSLIGSNALDQLTNVVISPLTFTDKRYILQSAVATLLQQYTQKQSQLEEVQQDLAQYGFLPKELVSLFQSSDVQVSLQRWLVALESIKFSTAIQVFSQLDTFITAFASYMGVESSYVKQQMQAIAARGDQDIYAFLSHCYMNPYELSYDCDIVGDFDVRYANQEANDVDPVFLKQLLYYIDQKLEQTELPSFNITFQKFDPRNETITFNIQVNTLQQDEAALVQAGIVNPHIYIVTNVIHLLKQNRFIQWSAIDTKQINIQPKVVKIGSNQFVVNNSSLQYTLPLQKDIAREIYDFE